MLISKFVLEILNSNMSIPIAGLISRTTEGIIQPNDNKRELLAESFGRSGVGSISAPTMCGKAGRGWLFTVNI